MKSNEQEIQELKTVFEDYKKSIDKKLDEIMVIISKPIFSDKQILSIIFGFIVYLVIAVIYVNDIQASTKLNKNNINFNKNAIENTDLKYDKILDMLILIQKDVAKEQGKSER